MIVCGVDVETTGLEFETAEITEIGWAIFDTERPEKPLLAESKLLKIQGTVPKDVVELTGITDDHLKRAGKPLEKILKQFVDSLEEFDVELMVAHNAPFDRTMLETALKRMGELPPRLRGDFWEWLDTRKDVPFGKKVRHKNLESIASAHGFINPFPHAALFDVFTMMKVLFCYDFDKVLAYRNEPTVYIKALVDFNNRDLAKKRGFAWQEYDGRTVEKSWIKAIKTSQLQEEKELANFTIIEI